MTLLVCELTETAYFTQDNVITHTDNLSITALEEVIIKYLIPRFL
jgi:hypothetical protein